MDDTSSVRSILVVGGGTAGWLSATYLRRALPDVKVTLVESSDIPTIGVGEATIPTLVQTFRFLGLEEEEWMPKCNATFKTAIRFSGWRKPAPGQAEHVYWHPFFKRGVPLVVNPYQSPYFPEIGEGIPLMHYWLQRHLAGDREPFAFACNEGPALCEALKSPRFKDKPEYELRSAYHFDAGLVAEVLKDVGRDRGVEHVVATVAGVLLDERGWIDRIKLEGGRELKADLYLDCSGFRGLLINQALQEPFLSDSGSLFNDSAIAIQSRHKAAEEGLEPYTSAIARSAGWIFKIPLYHRLGTGYVYSSKFLSQDEAEREFRDWLGWRGKDAEGKDLAANYIKIRVGRTRRPWVNNCVAVGLASCFLEPLESTGIFFSEFALASLVSLFPDRRMAEPLRRAYNDAIRACYEETRDFIVMHFVLTDREDTPYWRAVRHETKVPDTLQERLELFRESLPTMMLRDKFGVFRENNYACILTGMGHLPPRGYPLLSHVDAARADQVFAGVKERTQLLLRTLPSQYEYLTGLHYRQAQDPYQGPRPA